MWCGGRKHELLAQTRMRGFGAGAGRIRGSELAGSRELCKTVPRRNECCSIARALAGNGRDWARPVCSGALWNPDFVAAGSGCGSAFNTDGGADWRTCGISGRGLGADGDGADRFVLVAALVVFADYGAGVDAAECISTGLGAGDISAAGTSGLDRRGPSVVHDRGNAADVRL